MGIPTVKYLRKIVEASPNIVLGKRYDWKVKKKEAEGIYVFYRRIVEGDPWERYLDVPIYNLDNNIIPLGVKIYPVTYGFNTEAGRKGVRWQE